MTIWREEASGVNPRAARPPAAAVPTAGTMAAEKTAPDQGTPEFEKWVAEHCAKWLEGRGRDGAGLVALWDLAGDEALLLEAAERFPDDPRVCVAMIGHLTAKGGDAPPWAERLIAAAPDNPVGHYWKATLLAQAGKTAEALAALSAGTKVKGTPDQHNRDRIITAREAVLTSGGGVKAAAHAALAGPASRRGQPILGGKISAALRDAMSEAKAAGDQDRLVEVSGLAAAAAEHMRQAGAPALMDDLVTRSVLLMALKQLPPETEYGTGERTAGERLAEIEAETARTRELAGALEHVSELTDAQASEYTDRVILHGEGAAMRWLIQQAGAPRQGP